MLSKHGWGEKSRALGKNEQGIAEPLAIASISRSQGLGYRYANPGAYSRTNIFEEASSSNSNSNSKSSSYYPKGGFTFGDFVYNPPS